MENLDWLLLGLIIGWSLATLWYPARPRPEYDIPDNKVSRFIARFESADKLYSKAKFDGSGQPENAPAYELKRRLHSSYHAYNRWKKFHGIA